VFTFAVSVGESEVIAMATTAATQGQTPVSTRLPEPVVYDVTRSARNEVEELLTTRAGATAYFERRGSRTYLVTE
jgi:hypothetical protein